MADLCVLQVYFHYIVVLMSCVLCVFTPLNSITLMLIKKYCGWLYCTKNVGSSEANFIFFHM